MSVIEQKFADQLDPAFLDSGVDGEDYEKHAEIMRNKVKSLGLEERLIEVRRVTKVVKGGNILSFRAIVAVGNKKGKIAVGVGKGKEVMPATTKAVAEALRDIVEFPVAKNDSIPTPPWALPPLHPSSSSPLAWEPESSPAEPPGPSSSSPGWRTCSASSSAATLC